MVGGHVTRMTPRRVLARPHPDRRDAHAVRARSSIRR
jgi:hypothetical protein